MNLSRAADSPMNDPEIRARAAERRREVMQTDEWRANVAKAMRGWAQNPEWRANHTAANIEAHAKHYVFISPTDEIVEVYNLTAFSKENRLNQSNMVKVSNGTRLSHKGWTVYEPD